MRQNRWLAAGVAAALAAAPAWAADGTGTTDADTGTGAAEVQTDPAQTEGAPGAADSDVTNPAGPSSKSAGGINPTYEDEGTAELQGSGSDETATGSGADVDTGAAATSGTGTEGAADSEVTNPEPPSSKSAGGIDPGQEEDAAGTGASSEAASDTGAGATGSSGVDAPNVEGPDDPSTKSPGSINPSE